MTRHDGRIDSDPRRLLVMVAALAFAQEAPNPESADALGREVYSTFRDSRFVCHAEERFNALTYRFNGRDMRLTDVHGKVIEEVLA